MESCGSGYSSCTKVKTRGVEVRIITKEKAESSSRGIEEMSIVTLMTTCIKALVIEGAIIYPVDSVEINVP